MNDNKMELAAIIMVSISTSTGIKYVDVCIARFRYGYSSSRALVFETPTKVSIRAIGQHAQDTL